MKALFRSFSSDLVLFLGSLLPKSAFLLSLADLDCENRDDIGEIEDHNKDYHGPAKCFSGRVVVLEEVN